MSTVETVQQQLLARMLRGEFVPGHRLRQDALADELGVSKIPVREALHRLAARGLIVFESNRGAVVPSLTASDAEENFALRRAIEPQLLTRAIGEMTVVDLAEAELALSATDMAVPAANWVFHRALYRASGWERGLAIAEILHAGVAPYIDLYIQGLEGADDSADEHTELLDHCRNQNTAAAVDLLESHLAAAQRSLVQFLTD